MKVEIWYIGKTADRYLEQGMDIYRKRLKHYCKYNEVCIRDVKGKLTSEVLKAKEAEEVLSKLNSDDYLILLDERGKSMSSLNFSDFINQQMVASRRRLVFLIAGAYGADESLKSRANTMLSLSKMTFSHQMIRLFIIEQLYRAFTILKNEKYHNE